MHRYRNANLILAASRLGFLLLRGDGNTASARSGNLALLQWAPSSHAAAAKEIQIFGDVNACTHR